MMATTLEPVYKLGALQMLILATEKIGKPRVTYRCPDCGFNTDHIEGAKSSRTYVICLECGQGSQVLKA
jgi:peptide subunit release factor 1 (eRF1)